jgi:hypothetical protein
VALGEIACEVTRIVDADGSHHLFDRQRRVLEQQESTIEAEIVQIVSRRLPCLKAEQMREARRRQIHFFCQRRDTQRPRDFCMHQCERAADAPFHT